MKAKRQWPPPDRAGRAWPPTAEESRLRHEPAAAERRFDEYAAEVRNLKTDLAEERAIIEVRDVELAHLAEVVERARARTRAETAIANMQAAQAERGSGATPRPRVVS